ncbi:MAG: hypothetical protein AAGI03_00740 [Pseudomonadota bacterium]
MTRPLSKPPQAQAIVSANRHPSGAMAAWMRDTGAALQDLRNRPAIADADGTLVDLNTKFNLLLGALRDAGVLETS